VAIAFNDMQYIYTPFLGTNSSTVALIQYLGMPSGPSLKT